MNMAVMERKLNAKFLIEVLANREMTQDERDQYDVAYEDVRPAEAAEIDRLVGRIEWIKQAIHEKENRPMQTPMTDQGARPRGSVQEEISGLWHQSQQLGAGFQSLLERIQRLEIEMRGQSNEDAIDNEDAKAPAQIMGTR